MIHPALRLLRLPAMAMMLPLAAQLHAQLHAQSPAIPDPVRAGQELARRLRQAGPSQSASFTGTMVVARPTRTNTFAIASIITVSPTNWRIRYAAGPDATGESLTIVRTPSQPAACFTSDRTPPDGLGEPVTAAQLFAPFAGSDFWRVDLALDFFSWPQQRQITNQMRRGRACRVLESRYPNPAPGTYSRVVSWIDVETDGILRAEAYDHQNKLLKEFLVGSFRKVDGQYHLEEMTMRRPSSREETRIKFDLDPR